MRKCNRIANFPSFLALLVALGLGGGAYALAASGGGKITVCVRHTGGTLYRAHKCAKHDKRLSWNKQGPRGLRGLQGPQGPGGSILTYDAAATATPPAHPTVVGTALGDTWGAECTIPAAGQAKLTLFLKTRDGSFKADSALNYTTNGAPGTNATSADFPAGTFSSFAQTGSVTAGSAPNESASHSSFVQLRPVPGHVVVHLDANTMSSPTAQKCHMSVESFPETVKAVAGKTASHSGARKLGSLLAP